MLNMLFPLSRADPGSKFKRPWHIQLTRKGFETRADKGIGRPVVWLNGFLSALAIGFWYALELQLRIKWHKEYSLFRRLGNKGMFGDSWLVGSSENNWKLQMSQDHLWSISQAIELVASLACNAKAATGHQNLPFFVLSTDAQNPLSFFSRRAGCWSLLGVGGTQRQPKPRCRPCWAHCALDMLPVPSEVGTQSRGKAKDKVAVPVSQEYPKSIPRVSQDLVMRRSKQISSLNMV